MNCGKQYFLAYLHLLILKSTVLMQDSTDTEDTEEDAIKNEEAYGELIQFLDDKSLALVVRDAADDGNEMFLKQNLFV